MPMYVHAAFFVEECHYAFLAFGTSLPNDGDKGFKIRAASW